MPTAANGDNLYIGRGKFYFDRFDPATNLPRGIRRFIGEVDKGEISITVTNKERYTTTTAENQKIADVNTQQKHTINIDLMEFTKDNLALGLLGDATTYTQTSTPVSSEQLAVVHHAGDIRQLAERNVSELSLTGTSGSVTDGPLVLGTHYEIEDPKLSLIRMLTSGTQVFASYTPSGDPVTRIAAGQTSMIIGRLVFVGDPTNGPGFDLEAWKVKISPAGALALLSDDFASFSISGEILDDSVSHSAAPLYQLTYRDATAAVDPGDVITLADTSDGHTYTLQADEGNLVVVQGAGGASGVTTLTLADTANGNAYSVTTVNGNLTLTVASASGAVPSVTIPDQTDGHVYELTSVNGALTVTQIS